MFRSLGDVLELLSEIIIIGMLCFTNVVVYQKLCLVNKQHAAMVASEANSNKALKVVSGGIR